MSRPPAASPFAGGGDVGRVMESWDWAGTPVGPPEQWPASLRNIVRVLLTSRFSMWLGWGPDLAIFYNDAYQRDTLRGKHPWALGRPAREVWAEIWTDIGPRIQSVLDTGEATWDERLPLRLERDGYPEETYHTFSYSPLADDDGRVVGMLCVVREDTERVLGERRLRVLSELGDVSAVTAPTVEQACAATIAVLARARADVPFGSIYLVDESRTSARRAAFFGVVEGQQIVPTEVYRTHDRQQPMWNVLDTGEPAVMIDLANTYPGLLVPVEGPVGAADPDTAVAMPIPPAGGGAPLGVLFAGVSPFRALDEEYRRFLDLVARQVSSAITDAQTFQAQRRRAEELAELDRAKTEFFTGVSHELRTPLTLIAGPAEDALADTEEPLPADHRTRMELISRNAGRLRRLVDTLLEFSQLEAGQLIPHPVAVDLAALTRGIAESFAPAIHRAGLDFDIDCPDLGSAVSVDADMWEKIVLNLLSNAVKYTLGGRVRLSLSGGSGSGDPRSGGRRPRLRVADTGIGIPADEQPYLFERFRRVRGAAGRSHEGSGIGLALVAELTALHGGSVSVDSRPGHGSAFTVELPDTAWSEAPPSPWEATATARLYREEALQWSADEPGTVPDPAAVSAAASTGAAVASTGATVASAGIEGGATVVIAEDNADLRRFIGALLSPHYTVLLAADGDTALELARTRRPDLLLSDVMMPGLDGFELLTALRARPDTATIPVILLSARAGPEAVGEGLAAGADDYLVKPFSSHDLLARVRSNLTLARLRSYEGAWRTALLNALSDGVFVADSAGSIVEINDAFAEVFGYGREGLPYHQPYPWWPQADLELDEHEEVTRSLADYFGGDGAGRWQLPQRHRDGRRIWAEITTAPLPDGMVPDRKVVGTIRDVTAQHRATQRDHLLAETGRALTQPGDLSDRLDQCARAAATVLGELVLIIRTMPDGQLTVVAAAHPNRPELVEAARRAVPRRLPPPLEQRCRAGRAFINQRAAGAPPAVETISEEDDRLFGERSTLITPLTMTGRVHGMLAFVSPRGHHDDHEDLAMAEELGRRIAGAMEAERVAVLERRLHDASAALAAAATVTEAASALADAVKESIGATVVAVFTPDLDDQNLLLLRHVTDYRDQVTGYFRTIRVTDDSAASEVARTGEPVWLSDQQSWRDRYPTLPFVKLMQDVQAIIALPIRLGDQLCGVLAATFHTPRELPPEERRFVLTLVSQASQAFARAALTDARWRVSQTLQHSLLPTELPTLDRLALVAHYQPAGRDIHAGGDWYDVIALDSTRVAITVGDVVGNGPVAAATMGKLSSALAAYLREGHGPADALKMLSRYAHHVDQALGSTAICLILNTETGDLRGACAGHPPPLLLEQGGDGASVHFWEELRGVALGVPGAPPHVERRLTVAPGSSVLLYTDGLVERRGESIDDGLDRLRVATAQHTSTAPAALLSAALSGCLPDSGPADDVALVVARYLPPPLQAEVPARPEQLSQIRRKVNAWAVAGGLPEHQIFDLQLALGEAVANSVEHAYRDRRPGTVAYELALTRDRGVRARVEDHGSWRPPPVDPGDRGRGLAMLRALAGEVSIDNSGADGSNGTVVEFTLR